MRNRLLVALLSFFIAGACISEIALEVSPDEPKLVLDALISSNRNESMIIIGWTAQVGNACRDSYGNLIKCKPEMSSGPGKVNGVAILTEDDIVVYSTRFQMADRSGFIEIAPDVGGSPGHRYGLTIQIDYEGTTVIYSSETVMVQSPVIEEIGYLIRKGDVGKSDNFVPLISFMEPAGKHFYLFQLCQVTRNDPTPYCGNSRVWTYSIIRDDFLPQIVKGLSIDDGVSVAKYAEFYPPAEANSGAMVKMFSVSETTYNFYKALIDQFNNDGGAYSPTPATPPGNITGGALGLFRAVHESSATIFY